VTGDRREFLGRNGTLSNPAAMSRARLSGRTGAGMDPCAAMQTSFELAPGQEREVVFTLGAGAGVEEARNLAGRFQHPEAARETLERVWEYWKHTLGAVNVETPDASVNVLVNGWLLYRRFVPPLGAQRILPERRSVRLPRSVQTRWPWSTRNRVAAPNTYCSARRASFARATYNTGGIRPTAAGTHALFRRLSLAALGHVPLRVQHGRYGGIGQGRAFLEGRTVNAEEDSYYDLPGRSEETATLYGTASGPSCHGLRFGEHGLR